MKTRVSDGARTRDNRSHNPDSKTEFIQEFRCEKPYSAAKYRGVTEQSGPGPRKQDGAS